MNTNVDVDFTFIQTYMAATPGIISVRLVLNIFFIIDIDTHMFRQYEHMCLYGRGVNIVINTLLFKHTSMTDSSFYRKCMVAIRQKESNQEHKY